MRVRTILFAVAIASAAGACRDEPVEKVEEAAEEVSDKRQDLADEHQDVREADQRGEAMEERAEVAHAAADLSKAEVDFEREREVLVQEMRFRHHIFATQTAIARGMLADPALAEDDRQDATDKILTFERELGEAQLAVDAVATATAAQWEGVQTTVQNAFQQLEGAHDDAFEAVSADRKVEPRGDVRGGAPVDTRSGTVTPPEAEAPPAGAY